MFDVIIVGSGPAGVFGAYQLEGKKVLVIDVGHVATPVKLPEGNVYDALRAGEDLFTHLIGERFEGLEHLTGKRWSPKLKGPLMRFVTAEAGSAEKVMAPGFDAVISYAQGGLANAWGGGTMRFNERDLRGFPVSIDELNPHYDELTRHIGINGQADDLSPYFGSAADLMAPLALSPLARDFLERYQARKPRALQGSVRVGRTRAAILTQSHRGRAPYSYGAQDFFQPNIPAIYHPGYTLKELVREGRIEYRPGRLVTRFEEQEDRVRVFARDAADPGGSVEVFEAKRLMLAAGAINSARIALASSDDFDSHLPILDNPVSFIPLVNPAFIGKKAQTSTFNAAELIVIYDGELADQPIQSSFYGLMGPLRSDLLFEMPLSLGGNLIAAKYLLPAIAVLQVFYPDAPRPGNFLRLRPNGALEIEYRAPRAYSIEGHLLGTMRALGYYGARRFCKIAPPGSSIHYVGTLPMRESPGRKYETDRFGRLFGHKRVHSIDASTFPLLPSKNLTFTIMANAMRIAEQVRREL